MAVKRCVPVFFSTFVLRGFAVWSIPLSESLENALRESLPVAVIYHRHFSTSKTALLPLLSLQGDVSGIYSTKRITKKERRPVKTTPPITSLAFRVGSSKPWEAVVRNPVESITVNTFFLNTTAETWPRSRIWSKLVFASRVLYVDRAYCRFYMVSCRKYTVVRIYEEDKKKAEAEDFEEWACLQYIWKRKKICFEVARTSSSRVGNFSGVCISYIPGTTWFTFLRNGI